MENKIVTLKSDYDISKLPDLNCTMYIFETKNNKPVRLAWDNKLGKPPRVSISSGMLYVNRACHRLLNYTKQVSLGFNVVHNILAISSNIGYDRETYNLITSSGSKGKYITLRKDIFDMYPRLNYDNRYEPYWSIHHKCLIVALDEPLLMDADI